MNIFSGDAFQHLALIARQRGDRKREIPRKYDPADWDAWLPPMSKPIAPGEPPSLHARKSHEERSLFQWEAAPLPFRYTTLLGWDWMDRETYTLKLNRILGAWLDQESEEMAGRRIDAYTSQASIHAQLTCYLPKRIYETPLLAIADTVLFALCPIIGLAYGRVTYANVTVEEAGSGEVPYAEIDLYLPQEGA